MKLRTEIECIIATESSKNTHTNSETAVGNDSNPLPLWQACIYPALGTGDLQCSPGFLPPAAIHRALPWSLSPGRIPLPLTPQTRLNAFPTSLSRKEETTESPSVKIT